jgi:hypothetical protein
VRQPELLRVIFFKPELRDRDNSETGGRLLAPLKSVLHPKGDQKTSGLIPNASRRTNEI